MKTWLFKYVLIGVSILFSCAFGYMIGFAQKIEVSKPIITKIPDTNPRVPTVDIEHVDAKTLKGHVGEKSMRLRYQGKIVLPGKDGKFEISF